MVATAGTLGVVGSLGEGASVGGTDVAWACAAFGAGSAAAAGCGCGAAALGAAGGGTGAACTCGVTAGRGGGVGAALVTGAGAGCVFGGCLAAGAGDRCTLTLGIGEPGFGPPMRARMVADLRASARASETASEKVPAVNRAIESQRIVRRFTLDSLLRPATRLRATNFAVDYSARATSDTTAARTPSGSRLRSRSRCSRTHSALRLNRPRSLRSCHRRCRLAGSVGRSRR